MSKPKNLFFVEVTDTFGGEANYCWVRRFKVHASTQRGAMRKVTQHMGYGGVQQDWCYGDSSRWLWRNACICALVEDYQDHNSMHFDMKTL